jgi:8-oxo-dGTP diphosphatase
VKDWLVGGAVLVGPDGVLLVQNLRRGGQLDWTTPGGVIETHEGETLLDGLTREVEEETGLRVASWKHRVYEVVVNAPGLGWRLRAECWLADRWAGELRCGDDPDGIVVDARFVQAADCPVLLEGVHPWVREPLGDWLVERWTVSRPYAYEVCGSDRATMAVVRR